LGATEEQLDFTTVYAIGKDGVAMKNLDDERKNMEPLLDTILEKVTPAPDKTDTSLKAQPFNLGYDNFLGRLAIVRVYEGVLKDGQKVFVKKSEGEIEEGKITKIFVFEGTNRKEVAEVRAGDIAIIAGLPNIYIGDTVTDNREVENL
jgi:GTP-binding protein